MASQREIEDRQKFGVYTTKQEFKRDSDGRNYMIRRNPAFGKSDVHEQIHRTALVDEGKSREE